MSLPENRFLPFSPRVGLGCHLMKPTGRGSQTLLTRPARGEWWCAAKSVSAGLGDATGRLGTASRKRTLTSNEQNVRETPSRTYLRILRYFAIHGWLSVTAIHH